MASVNVKTKVEVPVTHEGAKSVRINKIQELRRSVLATMLFEDTFYEEGVSIHDRINSIIHDLPESKLDEVAEITREARNKQYLRHVPLLLIVGLLKRGYKKTSELIYDVIQRPDELTELLALYWKDKKVPLAKQLKKGLAKAFTKFNEYSLAKYNKDKDIKLVDVLFLSHAKPNTVAQALLWKKLVNKELEVPDTWEVELSKNQGQNKKESWERLIEEGKLGGLATLRNLRNFQEANVDSSLITKAIKEANYNKVLPFRFISASKYAPKYEHIIDEVFLNKMGEVPKLPGKTIVIIDVSGSMYGGNISNKSDMNRALAASALASIMREVCENPVIFATGGNDYKRIHKTELVPARRGMALVQAVYDMRGPMGGGGIFLNQVCNYIKEKEGYADRTIVITDEQDCASKDSDSPSKANPLGRGYLINVASYQNGIGYGKWTHIDGFSEACVDYILEAELGQSIQE